MIKRNVTAVVGGLAVASSLFLAGCGGETASPLRQGFDKIEKGDTPAQVIEKAGRPAGIKRVGPNLCYVWSDSAPADLGVCFYKLRVTLIQTGIGD